LSRDCIFVALRFKMVLQFWLAAGGFRRIFMADRSFGGRSIANRAADFMINSAMASLALLVTAVSAYTTYKGMIRIVGADAPGSGLESWLPIIVAGAITAVVQVGLTILCWVAGRDLARAITARMHERLRRTSIAASAGKFGAMLALILICLAVSVFYSFNTYFNSMYEGKEEKRVEAQAVPAVSLEVATLLGEAVSENQASSREEIRKLAEETGYFERMKQLGEDVAATTPWYSARFAEIEAARIEAEKQKIANEFDIRAKVSATEREIEARRQELAAKEVEILAAREAITQSEARIEALKAQERQHREEAAAQLRGDDQRAAGKGRAFARETAAADAALSAIGSEDAAIDGLKVQLDALENARLELEKAIGIASVDIANTTVGGTALTEEKLAVATVADIGAAVAALESARLRFEQLPVERRYGELQSFCEAARAIGAAVPDAGPRIAAVNCKSGSDVLESSVATFTMQDQKREAYSQVCGALASGALKPDKAVETLRLCHFSAVATGVDAESRKAEKAFAAIEAFAGKFDKNQHPFLKTLQAFAVSPRLAGLALFFALIQDVAVFIMTFMVEFFRRERMTAREEHAAMHLGDDEREAIRYLLAKCDPVAGRRDAYAFRFTKDRQTFLTPDEALAVKAVIEDLRARGLATANSRSSYTVSSAGFTLLQTRLRQLSPANAPAIALPRQSEQQAVRPAEPSSENVLELASRKKSL
jgi:hypothetical protein